MVSTPRRAVRLRFSTCKRFFRREAAGRDMGTSGSYREPGGSPPSWRSPAPAQRRVRIRWGPRGWGRAGCIAGLVLAAGVCPRVLPALSPLVTDLCGITLLVRVSYPMYQSSFVKKLLSAPARLRVREWGDAQALIETSWGDSAQDPRNPQSWGKTAGLRGAGWCWWWGVYPSHLLGSGSPRVHLGPWWESWNG